MIASESVTPPSSLIRAHASDQIPPTDSGVPCQRVFAGCCQSLLGDGPSRRYLCKSFPGCLDPYPVGSRKCTYPLLPSATSAFPPWDRGRRRENPVQRLLNGPDISGRQSFTNVQASKFASHPGRSYRCGSKAHRAAVAFTSEQNACRCLHAHRIC